MLADLITKLVAIRPQIFQSYGVEVKYQEEPTELKRKLSTIKDKNTYTEIFML